MTPVETSVTPVESLSTLWNSSTPNVNCVATGQRSGPVSIFSWIFPRQSRSSKSTWTVCSRLDCGRTMRR
ncbi:hypothetical protein DPMN_177498 [Dreissena polymorpha]|uniref:Uncharacterized protein n=1 Tax=Dreissena polymorpha TaxID=45954 RepID=A0A9D4ED56_DREPO|nr:hypothetical protein DPMN_177498 [Dreissena polymorpha]